MGDKIIFCTNVVTTVVWICNPDSMNIRIYNPINAVMFSHYKC